MIIHLSFTRNVWISATPTASVVTIPFTYPHILTLLTSNSLLSMTASLPSVLQLSLTYPHLPDEAQMNNHQASYLVCIHIIFVFQSIKKNTKKNKSSFAQITDKSLHYPTLIK